MFANAHCRFTLFATLLLMIPAAGYAQELTDPQWALCPAADIAPPLPIPSVEEREQVHLSADQVQSLGKDVTRFSGAVEIKHMGNLIQGDEAVYDKERDLVTISGNVRINGQVMLLSGDRAVISPSGESGKVENSRYHLRKAHAFGDAGHIEVLDKDHAHLEEVSYTTCVPGHEDWLLRAKSIDLDYATNTGEARNTTMRFKNVPILYLPYLNFPLYGRKSGLLVPSVGTSDSRGTDIRIPYYWNIAPDRDATTSIRNMTARGIMLESEFRYLNPSNNGQINFDYLYKDKRLNDEDRWAGHFNHSADLGYGWRTDLLYNGVSDTEYFNDLGDSQALTSQSYLERHADLRYQSRYWSFLGRAEGYQTIDITGDEPYRRLPQLKLDAASLEQPDQLKFDFSGELVNFAHKEETELEGIRLDIYPGVDLPLEGDAWFLKPRLALRYTQYQLENSTVEKPERTLPIASLDSGLFFERNLDIGNRPYIQTLEPRLYYLYVPYRDQDDLPLFDTSSYDFTFSQLFRENRFNGADRVGDANQISLALTTRLLDGQDGGERLSAGIGQIVYFSDREVTLNPSDTPELDSTSPYIGVLAFRPNTALELTANARYNSHTSITEVLTTRLRYHPGRDKSVTLGYRRREDENEEQTDIAAYWPLARQWQFLGRWQYDLVEERNLDVVAGLEYRSCCWGVRVVGRQLLNTTSGELENSIYLTFEFKGLSRIGSDLDSELERGILGR